MACSNQCFMAHFLSCDSILLVSVKVAFGLKNGIFPQFCLFGFSHLILTSFLNNLKSFFVELSVPSLQFIYLLGQ